MHTLRCLIISIKIERHRLSLVANDASGEIGERDGQSPVIIANFPALNGPAQVFFQTISIQL
jgi:hypothetical protein